MVYNQTVLKNLPSAKSSQARFQASLIEYDIDGKKEKALWNFLINPKKLSFADAADYTEIQTSASPCKELEYQGASGATLKISDLLMDTWCLGRSMRPLIDGIRALLRCRDNEFSPPVLIFRWGSRRVAPCVLKSVEWDEERFLSGEQARVRMSITLQEVPTPPTRAQLEAKEKKKQALIAARNDSQGKPKLPLTARQQTDASGLAKDYLNQNIDKFTPDIQRILRKKEYKLEVDKDSGDVSVMNNGKNLGVIMRSLGEKVITNKTIITLPLNPSAKILEIK
jgi:hypothetical protein